MKKAKIDMARPAMAIVVFLLLCTLFSTAFAQDRSYRILQMHAEAEVRPDGSMAVTETITMSFRGRYNGFTRRLNREGGIAYTGVSVSENGNEYLYHPGKEYGPPGTFIAFEDGKEFIVDWSFSAVDETRIFVLQYTVENVVTVYRDTAELYYQFFGDEFDVALEDAQVRLRLPEGEGEGEVLAFGHGPLHGEVTILDPREILFEASPLPTGNFLEGRVLFPTAWVPEAARVVPREAMAKILSEEQRWAGEANRRRFFSRVDLYAAPFLLVAGILLAVMNYLRFVRKYRPGFSGDYYRELPAEYTPGELGVLWRFGMPGPEDFTATILDLARRGILSIEEFVPPKKGLFQKHRPVDYRLERLAEGEGLQKHEKSLLEFLFTKVAKGDVAVSFGDIEEYARRKRQSFASFWNLWKSQLSARGTELGFFDESAWREKIVPMVLGVFLPVLGGAAISSGMYFSGPALVLSGLILFITSAFMRRRSRKGTEDYVRWKAFKRFLLHFSEMERHEIPSLVIWEHYLVYAVTLGVAKEVLKQLQLVYPDLQDASGYRLGGGWYYGSFSSPGNLAKSFDNMTATVTGSIQQSIRTATSVSSSGSGTGGGFSGGGGGGFGGGGGGAR